MSESNENAATFKDWAVLELMGHRRLGGLVQEATIAGGAFLRIDIPDPNDPDKFTATQFYSPASVYCLTPTSKEAACAVAKRCQPEPVQRWEMPQLTVDQSGISDREIDDYDDDR